MANQRKSFPLRISQDVFDELKSWADQEMRSINGQIEYVLKDAIRKRRGSVNQEGTDIDEPSSNSDVD